MVQVDDASRERRAQTAENERQAELLRELARMTEGLSAGQFRRLVLRSLGSGLLVLALAGCGSEGGGGDVTPCEADQQTVEAENTAPCCSQEPLTADDCPEGTTFVADEFGEGCKNADGAPLARVAKEGGRTFSLSEPGTTTMCSEATGRAVVVYDSSAGCVSACYDDDGHRVPRDECDPDRIAARVPACPGYE